MHDSIDFRIKEITEIVKGKLFSGKVNDNSITHLVIDSRCIICPESSLFFALVSKRNDGHKYISELYNKGVRNFIVSLIPQDNDKFKDANFILVENTLSALQLLGASHRSKFDIPVIGITGSNGKTIVKEWLYQLLSKDKNIVRNPKSFNSQIGVPLSVWQIEPGHEFAIFEAGISEPDEMYKLETIIQPTIGIFTNIGEAHGEGFVDIEQKVSEKLKLFSKVNVLIYCSDYAEIDNQIKKTEPYKYINCFTWGKRKENDLMLKSIERKNNRTIITGLYKNNVIIITISFVDNASIENAIHCWATMLYLGYDNKTIAQRMLLLTPVTMRLELKEGINNCSVINDSYNSDINSLSIALDFLNQQKQHKKRTLILSDILQSGRKEEDLYNDVSTLLKEKNIDRIIGIGEAISRQSDKFGIKKSFFKTTTDFLENYTSSLFQNETILLKGARIYEFERINKALQQKTHETVLEINLDAIIHNLNYYRSLLKPQTKIMAMVKAFSYGSGSFEIANILQYHRVDYLAVAYADEGVELRKTGILLPILVMNPEGQSFDTIINYNLEPEVYNFRILQQLFESIDNLPDNKSVAIHVKLDTGMHRLGFEEKDVEKLIRDIKSNKSVYIKSVFSHLAASDESIHDDYTNKQIEQFVQMSQYIKSSFDYPVLMHLLNSSGVSRFTEAQFDMVRLGIGLYGISYDKSEQKLLKNVSSLKTIISQIKQISANNTVGYNRKGIAVKNMTIATIPIGYADGLSRNLGNGVGKLMINNRPVPIVGNVCMDMCMIDITDVPANEGDEVIVFGDNYPISEIANQRNTIPYEVLTSISRRVKRIYYRE